MPSRLSPRIEPPCPISATVGAERGDIVARAVVSDISPRGARLRTDAPLAVNSTHRLHIRFAHPPEHHEVLGRVVWTREAVPGTQGRSLVCGVEWLTVSDACGARLCQLINTAVPPPLGSGHLFERAWRVREGWPPPPLAE